MTTWLRNLMGGATISQQLAIETIALWESKPAHELIFNSSHREIRQYMLAVDKILQSPKMNGFDENFAKSMARLKLEFQAVLSRQAHYTAGPSSVTEWSSSLIDSTASGIRFEDYLVYEKPNEKVISYLRNIAARMSIGGNLGDCIKAYISVRKKFLESQLQWLRFEELSSGGKGRKLDWEAKVDLWIQVSKICVELFFRREKNFCEEIFQNLGTAKDECFVGTVQDFAVRLFGFAESLSLSNQPYERMVSVFGLYDGFFSVLEVSDALFASEPGKRIRDVCSDTVRKIENDVKRMMIDFENAVLNEILKVPDDKGDVYRLTEYVMDRIKLLVSHKKLLTNLIKTVPSLRFGDVVIPEEELGDFGFRTFLDLHLILIIVVLLMNLEGKSKKYKDPILGDLFMMNNIHHIVQKIEGSDELHEMIGDLYLNKLRQREKQSMLSYQSYTSNKFLACFDDKGLYVTRWCISSRLSRTALKKRMKDFNDVFEHVGALHSSWTVPDSPLRDEIRQSLSNKLVPAYQQFLEKFRRRCGINSPGDARIKHSAEELKALVLEKLLANSS
ncbi:exocyst complex component EXO70A1-like [Primulina eburnea]|uniref:exocyst complex component EXO70A1-like n=1 Tax=Primulina eburnea TaxID=1245227 RepID=UPI003C6C939A